MSAVFGAGTLNKTGLVLSDTDTTAGRAAKGAITGLNADVLVVVGRSLDVDTFCSVASKVDTVSKLTSVFAEADGLTFSERFGR